jgi:hypothetical protein
MSYIHPIVIWDWGLRYQVQMHWFLSTPFRVSIYHNGIVGFWATCFEKMWLSRGFLSQYTHLSDLNLTSMQGGN